MFHRHKHAPAAVPVATPAVVPTVAVPAIIPVAPAPPGPILTVPLAASTTTAQTLPQQLPSAGGLLNKVKEVLPDPSKIANAVKSTAQSMTSSTDTTAPTQATITPVNAPVTMTPLAESIPAPLSAEMPVNFVKEERPAVVKERILAVEEESIQPIIHREVEKREIHEILQPIHERQVLAPTFEEKQLQAEFRPVIGGYAPRQAAFVAPSVEYAPKERTQIVRPPIIEETIRKTVIEEVQPVIHREVVKPHIIRQTQNIYEKILEPEVILKETRPMIECCSEQTFTGLKEQAAPLPAMATSSLGGKYVFEIDQKTKLKPLGTTNDVNLGSYQSTYRSPGAK